MQRLATTFVLGYHGCDEDVADGLVRGENFKPSNNSYDWLGRGIYFWETNPSRALEWALIQSQRRRSKIRRPAVVGAIVELGSCLDLTTKDGIDLVRVAYEDLSENLARAGKSLPNNGTKKYLRNLDCAVINRLHTLMERQKVDSVQTVRGVFLEGGEVYPGSGFEKKTHVQIAVVDPTCIKGVFLPRPYPTLNLADTLER